MSFFSCVLEFRTLAKRTKVATNPPKFSSFISDTRIYITSHRRRFSDFACAAHDESLLEILNAKMPNIPVRENWMGKRINKIAVLSQPFFCYGVVAFAVENYVHELQKKKKNCEIASSFTSPSPCWLVALSCRGRGPTRKHSFLVLRFNFFAFCQSIRNNIFRFGNYFGNSMRFCLSMNTIARRWRDATRVHFLSFRTWNT